MTHPVINRRRFLSGLSILAGGCMTPAVAVLANDAAPSRASAALAADYPRSDPKTVETFVGLAHRDLVEVRRMVEQQPSLARASWDWGFGDWETGLGAAAHTGGREIALLCLSHGAHATLFSAAMLGQLDVVRAVVSASPGIQGTLGPHGLTLLHHARVGGKDAEAVAAYLESVGGADEQRKAASLEPAERDSLVGSYVFGPDPRDRFDIDVKKDQLGIQRPGAARRGLTHTGGLVFFPSGVPSVRIAFQRSGARVTQLTVADPEVYLTAKRA